MKNLTFNNLPKIIKVFILFVACLFAITISYSLDGDFYFLYKTGEYISNFGFPHTDFLTIHSDMVITVQQWLAAYIYYIIYANCEKIGLYLLITIIYFCLVYLIFSISKLYNNNFTVNIFVTYIATFGISLFGFVSTRPQIFTFLLFAIFNYNLEKYSNTSRIKYLIFNVAISLLQINFHAAMWLMLFVITLPYIVSSIKFKIKKYNHNSECKFIPLAIFSALNFLVGFLNPYGFENMTYLFRSYGKEEINAFISEMQPVAIGTNTGKFFILLIVLISIISLFKNKPNNLSLRRFFMFFGMLVFSLTSYKTVVYFLSLGLPCISAYLGSLDFKIPQAKTPTNNKKRIVALSLVIIISIGVLSLELFDIIKKDESNLNVEASEMEYSLEEDIDNICEYIPLDENAMIFNGFDIGQYLEYKGYKAFIDGRAELFYKDNNKSFDYFSEYVNAIKGKSYYKDFVDKYEFEYLIVSKNYELPLCISLLNDEDFEVKYESKNYVLFFCTKY